jgi:hypothetical protein
MPDSCPRRARASTQRGRRAPHPIAKERARRGTGALGPDTSPIPNQGQSEGSVPGRSRLPLPDKIGHVGSPSDVGRQRLRLNRSCPAPLLPLRCDHRDADSRRNALMSRCGRRSCDGETMKNRAIDDTCPWGDRTSGVLAERASASTAMESVRRCAALQGHGDTRSELAGRRRLVVNHPMVLGGPVTGRLLATGTRCGGGWSAGDGSLPAGGPTLRSCAWRAVAPSSALGTRPR